MISWKKWNPIWWFKNDDDPVVPPDKWPDEPEWKRKIKWFMRNPMHNFTFYVMGCADKNAEVEGEYPGDVFNPEGGWKKHIVKKCVLGFPVPFISYISKDGKVKFYIGWRERGNFGIKWNWHK